MENGVSGGDVRRACRNDNEDNALGERATGRTSSGAKRGEPITFGGESTALKWQKSLIGATFISVSQPDDPPAFPGSDAHTK